METAAPAPATDVPHVQVDFTLSIGPGRLDASLAVPASHVTLVQLLPALQTLTSNIVDSAVAIVNAEGFQVSCRAGCAACCRQLIPLSIFEAEYLTQWIRTLPPAQQEALEARFHATLLTLRDHGLLERMDPALWSANSPDAPRLALDYLAAKVPCPFLVDESCSIYPIRPLVCREYLVTSPPEFCAAPLAGQIQGIPMPLKPSSALFKLGEQVDKTPPGWIPLVFLFVWMHSDLHPGDRIAGTGPEILYEFVKRLTTEPPPSPP